MIYIKRWFIGSIMVLALFKDEALNGLSFVYREVLPQIETNNLIVLGIMLFVLITLNAVIIKAEINNNTQI